MLGLDSKYQTKVNNTLSVAKRIDDQAPAEASPLTPFRNFVKERIFSRLRNVSTKSNALILASTNVFFAIAGCAPTPSELAEWHYFGPQTSAPNSLLLEVPKDECQKHVLLRAEDSTTFFTVENQSTVDQTCNDIGEPLSVVKIDFQSGDNLAIWQQSEKVLSMRIQNVIPYTVKYTNIPNSDFPETQQDLSLLYDQKKDDAVSLPNQSEDLPKGGIFIANEAGTTDNILFLIETNITKP